MEVKTVLFLCGWRMKRHRHMSGRPAVQGSLTMIKNIRRQEYTSVVHMLVKWDGSSILIHR